MASSKNSIYQTAVIGLMSAMVFVGNFISIPIGDISRIHFGNIFCLLSGFILGPVPGGVCAGLGGFLYDLTNPLYAREAVITFFIKFVLGFFAGFIAHRRGYRGSSFKLNLLGGIIAGVIYLIAYLGKNFIELYWYLKNPMETVLFNLSIKALSSTVNAVIAVVVSLILAPVFIKALKASGIEQKLFPNSNRDS